MAIVCGALVLIGNAMDRRDKSEIVIEMQQHRTVCAICGVQTKRECGIPVDAETGLVVANTFSGECGGVDTCRKCWAEHSKGTFVGTLPRF